MARKTYTDAQKAEILKKAEETSIEAASKEYGVDRKTIRSWKVSAKVTAEKIEAKKAVHASEQKAKEKIAAKKEKAAAKKVEKKEVKDAVAAELKDARDIEKIEIKKKTRAAGKKIQETVKKPEIKTGKPNLVFQSILGGAVTPEDICAKLPKEATDAYVKIEENKIYWVGRNGETGSMDIW